MSLRRPSIPSQKKLVEVLYNYDSQTSRGHTVNVRPGEKYSLLNDSNSEWWYVAKETGEEEGFYLPSSYISAVQDANDDLGSFKPIADGVLEGGDSYRRSHLFSSDGYKMLTAPGGHSSAAKRRSTGFKVADPQRISRSIPVDLNFVHNIPDLVAAQMVKDRMRDNGEDVEFDIPTAVPRVDLNASFHEESSTLPAPILPSSRRESEPNESLNLYQNLEENRAKRRAPIPIPDQKPERQLDEGWEEHVDISSGRRYFFHPSSGTSTWKPPRLMAGPDKVEAMMKVEEEQRTRKEEPAPPLPRPPPSPSPDPADEGYSSQMTASNESNSSPRAPTGSVSRNVTLFNKSYGLRLEEDVFGPEERRELHTEQKSIKEGTLTKCKFAESGKRLKKQWTPCYVHLNNAHLIFYKDEKSAEKHGNHYNAPLGVCDLRGARFGWSDQDKTRRKRVFQVELIDGTIYLFHSDDQQNIISWFDSIKKVLVALPEPDRYPRPVPESERRRSSTNGERESRLENGNPPPPTLPSSPSHLSKKPSQKDSKRSVNLPSSSPSKGVGDTPIESRQTILEKLRKFFRSRPSVDTLKEKGIYKPEPVFGSSLIEICTKEQITVPKFIRKCTEAIEAKGLETDGLYRISGNLSQIQKIRCQVDQDKYGLLESEEDIHVLSGALKLFFRELQDPVFPVAMTKDFLNAIKVQDTKQRLKIFRELLAKMPEPHRDTLHFLLLHLLKVAEFSKKNRMQSHNLAIVFGPTLFSSGGVVQAGAKSGAKKKDVKGAKGKKEFGSRLPPAPSDVTHSNSHLAFNMIMQGQIVEFLLRETERVFP